MKPAANRGGRGGIPSPANTDEKILNKREEKMLEKLNPPFGGKSNLHSMKASSDKKTPITGIKMFKEETSANETPFSRDKISMQAIFKQSKAPTS